ncbi:MAG: L-ascorbate metabolism protein UlaG (beta-lactamase superfamily) [Natronomonas sp.]|jgi:L-ascorbate metabolism protein UlaG (beta-lactamase superfamily)
MTVTRDGLTVEWLGYATVRVEGRRTVYLDPGRYGVLTGGWEPEHPAIDAHPPGREYRPEDADLVCLSHVHHYDDDGVERVADDRTTILAFEGINPRDSGRDLPRLSELDHECRAVSMEDDLVAADLPVWTVPAYNEPDGPHTTADGTPFHPEGLGCGFVISFEGTTVFWPGDTDVLEGHAELDVDVFLPPIGGAFTMDRREAAELAEQLDPELVVPVHYNTFEALETDSAAFAEDCRQRGVEVALDEG